MLSRTQKKRYWYLGTTMKPFENMNHLWATEGGSLLEQKLSTVANTKDTKFDGSQRGESKAALSL